ncbi:MAG: TOBE domain-containing protein, partial [Frankia sp.]
REVGITFVYVTHDESDALTMSARIAVMNGGRIEHLGPPREIYERPATRFVAGFIGTSNLLTAPVRETDSDCSVLETGPEERLLVPLRADRPTPTIGTEVELTVRPEKIQMSPAAPDGSGCRLRGTVTEVVYLGTSTTYTVVTSTGDDVTVFRQNGSDAEDIASRGQQVWLSWRPEHSYALAASPSDASKPSATGATTDEPEVPADGKPTTS